MQKTGRKALQFHGTFLNRYENNTALFNDIFYLKTRIFVEKEHLKTTLLQQRIKEAIIFAVQL